MLKIVQLKIDINTTDGHFGASIPFDSGLTIIRGDNTTGKSTALECVLYCLGMEELLGGRNEKTMQSVLKDEVEEHGRKFPVIESTVSLEISNGKEAVVVKRAVKSTSRDPRLVEVYKGPAISIPSNEYSSDFMFLHDPGAATDIEYGFHNFLEAFMGVTLPQVEQFSGGERKLYLQCVFPSFYIEQKSGWSDFMATIPNFGIRGVKSRAVEFILGLDVIENIRKKQGLAQKKAELLGEWRSTYQSMASVAKRINGRIVGIENQPTTLMNSKDMQIRIFHNEQEIPFGDYVFGLHELLKQTQVEPIPKAGANRYRMSSELERLIDELNEKRFYSDRIITEINDEATRLSALNIQLQNLNTDLKKNRTALKVENYGAQLKIGVSEKICPTCQQPIKDFLLPQEIDQSPLGIDQNISFLEEQKKMVLVYIQGLKGSIEKKKRLLSSVRSNIDELNSQIRTLREDSIAPDQQPSAAEIEKRINLKQKISALSQAEDQIAEYVEKISVLSSDWKTLLKKEAELPKEFFSEKDTAKLDSLETIFKDNLTTFGYRSKALSYVSISRDSYLPNVESMSVRSGKKDYDIRFDSSASDFIRSIWAYMCALYEVSTYHGGNHPSLLIIDEPAQHSMSNENLASFLKRFQSYKDAQVIVAASFNNSESDFQQTTKGVEFKRYRIGDRLISRKNSNR